MFAAEVNSDALATVEPMGEATQRIRPSCQQENRRQIRGDERKGRRDIHVSSPSIPQIWEPLFVGEVTLTATVFGISPGLRRIPALTCCWATTCG